MFGLFSERKIVLATHNEGKVREFEKLIALPGVSLVTAGSLGLAEPEETGTTFAENAKLKALEAMKGSGLPALADDSGLSVGALHGAPGVYSARWAGPSKDFAAAMEKLRQELSTLNMETSPAAFVAALCLALPDGSVIEAEGIVKGYLRFPPSGTNGFGYDPIFVPEGHDRSFGEMVPEEKHKLSHRSRAVEELKKKVMRRFFGS
jgi:XTP/dITP diphosphohydrolase